MRLTSAATRAADLAADPARFHLFLSYACPFAHRLPLTLALKRLDGLVAFSVLHPRWNTPDG